MSNQALEGIKILDLSWAIAGPLGTTYLANHGATVVRIESQTKVDLLRVSFPYANNVPGLNRSANFASVNTNKYSMALDLDYPLGIEVARKLVTWADVVVENFRPGKLEEWGLGYEDLVKLKADIIMVRAGILGQTGPQAGHVATGHDLQAYAGFAHFIGWTDRSPVGTQMAYTDFITPWYLTIAILASLDYRRRTGRGLYVDLSQLEASVQFLIPPILDFVANGRVDGAMGNRCSYAVPHGAYRCRGDDRWCAIAIFNDKEWRAFCRVIGEPEWTGEPKFNSLLSRKENEDELDLLIEQWTVNYPAEELVEKMQAAGIAASIVATGSDLHEDPQLGYRHHFVMMEHAEMGKMAYDHPSFRLSKTPCRLRTPAPCLGEHTEYVGREILEMSDEEFLDLHSRGIFR